MNEGNKMSIELIFFVLGFFMMILGAYFYVKSDFKSENKNSVIQNELKAEIESLKVMIKDVNKNQQTECSSLWGSVNELKSLMQVIANKRISATLKATEAIPVKLMGTVPIEVIKRQVLIKPSEQTPLLNRAGVTKQAPRAKSKSNH